MRKRVSGITLWVVGFTGVFLVTFALAAATLIWQARQEALAQSDAKAVLFLHGAQAALNRSLLGVDVLLASMDGLLGLSGLVAQWIEPAAASRLMQGAVQQNLMVRYVALLDADGRVMASSDSSGANLGVSLPAGFIAEVLAQAISTLTVSAPVVSFASSERVLYFARPIKLADGSRVLAVAEVQVPYLTAIMVQGVDIAGLEVTLERGGGQLLASVPTQEQLLGTQLPLPLGGQRNPTEAQRLPARLSGVPAIVVIRPILSHDVLITASIPIEAALQDWRAQRSFIIGVAALFGLMILAAGGFARWYLRRLAQARMVIAESKATLDQALESMVSGFLLLDAQHKVVTWNQRLMELYPWLAQGMARSMPFQSVIASTHEQLVPAAGALERQRWIEWRMAALSGGHGTHEQAFPGGQVIQITERPTPDGGTVIVYEDVTLLRKASVEIELMAFYDPLTKLPNRRLLIDRLQHAMVSSARSGMYGALLFLDLDHFKTLNDTLGHDLGDLLLEQAAERLKACVRERDTVARHGGDEFVIMLEELSNQREEAAAQAQEIGEKILQRLNQAYQLDGHTYHGTLSIGATLFDARHQAAAELLKQADIAMYQVKTQGRNAFCFFDPQMQEAITTRAQLEKDLKDALLQEQFVLYYQPQFSIEGRVVGAEALIRWMHPTRGLVPPGEFISVAEEGELIVAMGQWVLRTACQRLAAWRTDSRAASLQLSVNVSARQFHQTDFVAQVAAVIVETGAQADLLKLELTESLVLNSVSDAIVKMSSLKALGVRFSVDDFGTGHSSLAYLTRLPLDQLKIDQSFVRNIGIKSTDGVIVQTIIGMARNLGLEVIAEGVETRAQQEFLALHGCNLYQGYLFGKPAPLAEFEALLG